MAKEKSVKTQISDEPISKESIKDLSKRLRLNFSEPVSSEDSSLKWLTTVLQNNHSNASYSVCNSVDSFVMKSSRDSSFYQQSSSQSSSSGSQSPLSCILPKIKSVNLEKTSTIQPPITLPVLPQHILQKMKHSSKKPIYSNETLCRIAFKRLGKICLSLADILQWCSATFDYFSTRITSQQLHEDIKQTLIDSKLFIQVGCNNFSDLDGIGIWTVAPEYIDEETFTTSVDKSMVSMKNTNSISNGFSASNSSDCVEMIRVVQRKRKKSRTHQFNLKIPKVNLNRPDLRPDFPRNLSFPQSMNFAQISPQNQQRNQNLIYLPAVQNVRPNCIPRIQIMQIPPVSQIQNPYKNDVFTEISTEAFDNSCSLDVMTSWKSDLVKNLLENQKN